MSRNELSPDAIAELAALDAIIAGDSVGEDRLELAALVDSVRAAAPEWTPQSERRVQELLGAAQTRRRLPRPQLARPRVALAGGTAFALVLALVAVIASGALRGGSARLAEHPLLPAFHSSAPSSGAAASPSSLGPASGTTAGTGSTASVGPVSGAIAGTGPAASVRARAGTAQPPNTNPTSRIVARNASLTLAATASAMQSVANEVVASTVRLGGIVESSNVDVHGLASYASFNLSVPSSRLPALIGALSSLAAVRSLDQGSVDITDSYDAAAARVAELKAERAGLLHALADATTLASQQAITARLRVLDAQLATSTQHVGELRSRGANARVAVAIVAARAAAGAAGGGGPVNRALNDALSVLEVALAIALVALAIVLPVGLVVLAMWWAQSSLRQRSRERALQAAR